MVNITETDQGIKIINFIFLKEKSFFYPTELLLRKSSTKWSQMEGGLCKIEVSQTSQIGTGFYMPTWSRRHKLKVEEDGNVASFTDAKKRIAAHLARAPSPLDRGTLSKIKVLLNVPNMTLKIHGR